MMNLLISLLVFALIFGGALAGMAVRPLLSAHHLHSDSKDVVRLTAGLVGTLTALVLGLLIASAKTTFDQKTNRVRELTATVILLDDLLTQYGPEATSLRQILRQSIPPMADRIWHEQAHPSGKPARFESSVEAWAFYDAVERLSPNNDTQRSLQSRTIAAFTEGAQMRLQLFTQAGSTIPTPFLKPVSTPPPAPPRRHPATKPSRRPERSNRASRLRAARNRRPAAAWRRT